MPSENLGFIITMLLGDIVHTSTKWSSREEEQTSSRGNKKHSDFVRNATGHNRLTRVYMWVERSRIAQYRQKAENTEAQDFNVEKQNREKLRGTTNLRNRIIVRRGSTIRYSKATTSRPSSSNRRL